MATMGKATSGTVGVMGNESIIERDIPRASLPTTRRFLRLGVGGSPVAWVWVRERGRATPMSAERAAAWVGNYVAGRPSLAGHVRARRLGRGRHG
jgi:hypothetical protein